MTSFRARRSLVDPTPEARPILPVAAERLDAVLSGLPAATALWARRSGLTGKAHEIAFPPGEDGAVWLGVGEGLGRWSLADAARRLPPGVYRLDTADRVPDDVLVGWLLGGYVFDALRSAATAPEPPSLCWPDGADRERVLCEADAVAMVRDLVNLPANLMGPLELVDVARAVSEAHGAELTVLSGEDLLAAGYPTIHAVGRASPRPPTLIDLAWGAADAPRLILVGKGVCFDTGGVNLKPAAGMLRMKKDMAGAAHALALGRMIMEAGLPVRLRVLIPAVDNAVGGDAMRPLDVIRTRKGLSVEIGHTDAEGRLVLADALAEAASDDPDVVIDFATLTSAARVALGPDVPALFCNDETLAAALTAAGAETDDPFWRMPLWAPYLADLEGQAADLSNVAGNDFAGAIYAALFLQTFVEPAKAWAHFDIFAWNGADQPGRPRGGEAQTLRAAFACIEARYRA